MSASFVTLKFSDLERRVCLINGLLLVGAGLFTTYDALSKLSSPVTMHSRLAMGSACVGLAINAACAFVIQRKFNISEPGVRSAFLHIIADIITSVAAIVAILVSAISPLTWVDPTLGLLGGMWIALLGVSLLNNLRSKNQVIEIA